MGSKETDFRWEVLGNALFPPGTRDWGGETGNWNQRVRLKGPCPRRVRLSVHQKWVCFLPKSTEKWEFLYRDPDGSDLSF